MLQHLRPCVEALGVEAPPHPDHTIVPHLLRDAILIMLLEEARHLAYSTSRVKGTVPRDALSWSWIRAWKESMNLH